MYVIKSTARSNIRDGKICDNNRRMEGLNTPTVTLYLTQSAQKDEAENFTVMTIEMPCPNVPAKAIIPATE